LYVHAQPRLHTPARTNEIKALYKKSDIISKSIHQLKTKLKSMLSFNDFKQAIKKINQHVENKRLTKMKSINKKLQNLFVHQEKENNSLSDNSHQFYPRMINLTDINFSEVEKTMLGKYNKYNPPPNTHKNQEIKDLIIETETAISFVDKHKQEEIRFEAAKKIGKIISNAKKRRSRKRNGYDSDKRTIKQIQNKILNGGAKVVPADKSSATVVIMEQELNDKVQTLFTNNGVIEMSDKTQEYNKKIRELIDNSLVIHPNKRKFLYNAKAKPPVFKPLIKTHKTDKPVRPVINSINAPSYNLSKFLCNLIKSRIDLESKHTCKNSRDFIDSIKGIKIDTNNTLITVDIDNMYSNIPRDEALTALKEKLEQSDMFSEEEIVDILKMVEEIMKQNYFVWEGKIYYDPKGLPMGGPLSALLAEIYLQKFEKENILCSKNEHSHKIMFYKRYVDDIFIITKTNKRQSKLMIKHFNQMHKSIKFKMEEEINNNISFLDVKVIRNEQTIEFGIHRKSTQTDSVIPRESNHPMTYKMAAFRSMVHRLLTYNLTPQEYEKERGIIKQIAYNNGYEPQIIDNIIRKTKFNLTRPREGKKEEKSKTFIPMGYVSKHSQHIGNILKKANYYPGFKVNKRFSINETSQRTNKADIKGVYLIECDTKVGCNRKYIGYTNRSLKERFKEHTARNQKNPSSVVAQHLKNNPSHNIEFNKSMHILKKCSDKIKAQVYEKYFIYKDVVKHGKTSLLNKKEDFSENISYRLLNELEETRTVDNS